MKKNSFAGEQRGAHGPLLLAWAAGVFIDSKRLSPRQQETAIANLPAEDGFVGLGQKVKPALFGEKNPKEVLGLHFSFPFTNQFLGCLFGYLVLLSQMPKEQDFSSF